MRINDVFKTSYSSWSGQFIRMVEDSCAESKGFKKEIASRVAALALLVIVPLELLFELPAAILIIPLFTDCGGGCGRSARNTIGSIATLFKSIATIFTGKLAGVSYDLYGEGISGALRDLVINPVKRSTLTAEKIRANLQTILTNSDSITQKSKRKAVGKQLASVAKSLARSLGCDESSRPHHHDYMDRTLGFEIIEKVLGHQRGLPTTSFIKAIAHQAHEEALPMVAGLMKNLLPVSTKELVKLILRWQKCDWWKYRNSQGVNRNVLDLLINQFFRQPNLTQADINVVMPIAMVWANSSTVEEALRHVTKEAAFDALKMHQDYCALPPSDRDRPLASNMPFLGSREIPKNNLVVLLPWLLDRCDSSEKEKMVIIFSVAMRAKDLDTIRKMLEGNRVSNDTVMQLFQELNRHRPYEKSARELHGATFDLVLTWLLKQPSLTQKTIHTVKTIHTLFSTLVRAMESEAAQKMLKDYRISNVVVIELLAEMNNRKPFDLEGQRRQQAIVAMLTTRMLDSRNSTSVKIPAALSSMISAMMTDKPTYWYNWSELYNR